MSKKYKNKFRNESARLPHWDYGSNAAYFITICTKDREYYFGEIKDGEMILNDVGQIASECWLMIPEHFLLAKLGNHVIMPNHVHGIEIIDKPNITGNDERDVGTRLIASQQPKQMERPKTAAGKPNGGITGNYNPMLHDNLSKIIRWYKGRTSFGSAKSIPVSPGSPGFTITSSETMNLFTGSLITLKTILPIGRRMFYFKL